MKHCYTFSNLIVCIILLISCSNHKVTEMMDYAEDTLAQNPEEALAILNSIDISSISSKENLQARYALLYTKTQYKNYIDATSDSLISLAVNYYQKTEDRENLFYSYLYQGIVRYYLADDVKASVSLLRALANAGAIEDHFSIGQLYVYLSQINGNQFCTDEYLYAEKAYEEYISAGLLSYATNALAMMAVAKIRSSEFDASRELIDRAIAIADSIEDRDEKNHLLSIKAQYALLTDSLTMAEDLLRALQSDSLPQLSDQDLGNLAVLNSLKQDKNMALFYLNQAQTRIISQSDRARFWLNSMNVGKNLHDDTLIIASQDSLIKYGENLLSESLRHSTTNAEREYAEWRLTMSEISNREKTWTIVGLIVSLISLSVVFVLYDRKKNLKIQLQKEIIKNMQLENLQNRDKNAQALLALKASEAVKQIQDAMTTSRGLTQKEWNALDIAFEEKLPHYGQRLRKMTSLNETEWRVCMLLKISMSPKSISILMNKTPGTISSARERLYKKVVHPTFALVASSDRSEQSHQDDL